MNWLALLRALPAAVELAAAVVKLAGSKPSRLTPEEAKRAADEAHRKLDAALERSPPRG